MATIHVDGKALEVNGADNLLQACLSLGLDIPYFCWHPALGSVGACRQCAVKQYTDENDTRGRIVMSCMTPASDGTWISIDDEESKAFRASVVEWLMTNHPHDCPVCEEGGHCHLQDMTVMTGHNERRYRFTKRTHQNQDLGPFIAHEMNRCIACYRCVRYYKDYAGGTDLCTAPTTTCTSVALKTACWKASSPATSPRSARPVCSPTRPTPSATTASGTCSSRRASAMAAPAVATSARVSATANCAASKTVSTVR
jgi:predicted molibdopterin-dependent oxidoreductase YjgC